MGWLLVLSLAAATGAPPTDGAGLPSRELLLYLAQYEADGAEGIDPLELESLPVGEAEPAEVVIEEDAQDEGR